MRDHQRPRADFTALRQLAGSCVLLFLIAGLSYAQTYTVVHDFLGGNEPSRPTGSICAIGNGLYGAGYWGGSNGEGAVYGLNLSTGQLSTLYSFSGYPIDGSNPNGITCGKDGKLYGATTAGGIYNSQLCCGGPPGNGTIFRVDPTNGTTNTLHSFNGCGDGSFPPTGLIQGRNGNIYGTCGCGAEDGWGDVYSLALSNNYPLSIVHAFNFSEPLAPAECNLLEAKDGKLYGVTSNSFSSASYGAGGIFTIDPSTGALTTIHWFNHNDSSAGAKPRGGLIQASNGKLYGTTTAGGTNNMGAIFAIDPANNNSFTIVYSFAGSPSEGDSPVAELMQAGDGMLYGVTNTGGANSGANGPGAGTVFKFNISTGELQTIHNFDTPQGEQPLGSLIQTIDGNLYGTTTIGGAFNNGVIFRIELNTAPFIVVQAQSQTVVASTNVTFSVTAGGTGPLSYQWWLSNNIIPGATGPSLTINNVQLAANAGNYSVVVKNAFGSVTSASASLTVLSNLNGSVSQPTYGTTTVVGGAVDSLVFITHGRIAQTGDQSWIYDMARLIRNKPLPSNWEVQTHEWANLAAVPVWEVLSNARAEGQKIANDIYTAGLQTPDKYWHHIHFIAHSAGAALVEEVAASLRDHIPTPEIHITLLDPDVGLSYRNVYGKDANWADDYFAFDLQTLDEVFGLTTGALAYAYSVDVTQLYQPLQSYPVWCAGAGAGPCRYQPYATHGWPIAFYEMTITDPNFAQGYGYYLSKEGGGWSNHGSLAEGPPAHVLPTGSNTTVQGPLNLTPGITLNYQILPNATSQTGSVQTTTSGFNATAPALAQFNRHSSAPVRHNQRAEVAFGANSVNAASTAPVWISVPVYTSADINYIQFDLSFTSAAGSAGLVTVYWNDMQIGVIDERYCHPTQNYVFAVEGASLSQNNCLGFRLDAFANVNSSISVTNVTTGFAGLPQPPQLSIAGSSGNLSMTLTGTQGYTFLIQASTDLSNWTPISNVSLTDGSTAQFTDLNSSQFNKRFYRAVSP